MSSAGACNQRFSSPVICEWPNPAIILLNASCNLHSQGYTAECLFAVFILDRRFSMQFLSQHGALLRSAEIPPSDKPVLM